MLKQTQLFIFLLDYQFVVIYNISTNLNHLVIAYCFYLLKISYILIFIGYKLFMSLHQARVEILTTYPYINKIS